MPNNQCEGELEDFIFKMIPSNNPALPRTKKYIDNIPEEDRKFKSKKLIRAYVHAWLATREKPRQTGLAISARYLDKNVGTKLGIFMNGYVSYSNLKCNNLAFYSTIQATQMTGRLK